MVTKTYLKVLVVLLLMLLSCKSGYAQMQTDTFTFSFEGKRYSGLVNTPTGKTPKAMVVIVTGSGKTNIVAGNGYSKLRSHLIKEGLACLVWDKAGCGKSEGVFNYDQTVQNSASEVIAAITEAKSKKIPGSEKVGLWGISRGGWICPLVIDEYPVDFWISVSGPDDKENFGYLLESNFRIEGRSEAQTQLLVSEWKKGNEVFRNGGSFEEYQKATQNLRIDSFWLAVSGSPYTSEGYARNQKNFLAEKHLFDEETGLGIYVPEFDKVLNKIHCPVLAIFGEKDSQVDWKKTKALYEKTMGSKPSANLTIKVLPNCNHIMLSCKTGGYREDLSNSETCPGYYDTMLSWLKEQGFGS